MVYSLITNLKGPKGDKGGQGDPGRDGSNVLPTDQAISTALSTAGTPPNLILVSTAGGAVKAAVGTRRPVGQRTHYNTATPYNGAETQATYKMAYPIKVDAENLTLLYALTGGSKEAAAVGTLTLKVSIAGADGVRRPVTFAGQRTVTWKPGDALKTDMITGAWKAGNTVTVYTHVSAAGAAKWPLGRAMQPGDGEGVIYGQDYTDAGAVPNVFVFGLGPQAIEGTVSAGNLASVALIGDSIQTGQGDSPSYMGFAARALAPHVPYLQVSLPGDTARDYVLAHTTRRLAAQGVTHAITNYGTNDRVLGRTADQMKADLVTIWNEQVADGIKPYALTLPPRTTSTDGFATPEGQTPVTGEAARLAVNAWIRTTPAPLAGYFDLADAWESARNSGVWKPNLTGDGIHPNPAGHLAGAASIDPTVFTSAPGKVAPRASTVAGVKPERYTGTMTGHAVSANSTTWADTGAKVFTHDVILMVEFSGAYYQADNQPGVTVDSRLSIGGAEARLNRRTYPATAPAVQAWQGLNLTASKFVPAGASAQVTVSTQVNAGTGVVTANATGNYNGLTVVAIPA